jgi:eukaryotic-like serine/threonine-protein kinase
VKEVPIRLSAALADHYNVERVLGEGGMATVYLAHDVKHKRKVAVKVLKPELAAVLGADRFVQEIATTAALQHPNILPLFDSGTADGFLYYVMPYIDGETLRDKLNRETQFGVDESVKIAVDIADALHYAHTHGVIHRDIKPENILLANGKPMVSDFGIALAVSAAAGGRMTETGLSLGTPHYMSPEQATAEKDISARSDVYSLASVLFEMLAGQPPHLGGSAQQIIMKIITETPQSVSQLRKSVPQNVASAVAKALEKLPADRFDSAKAFADALANTTFATVSSEKATRAADTSWRARIAAPALATVALLLAAGAYTWLRPSKPATVTRQRVVLWKKAIEPFLAPGVEKVTTQAAIAPDGSSIVFSDSTASGLQLFRKLRSEHQAVPIAGTENGTSPFFSPDGRWIGYATLDGKLRKVPVEGGGSVTLASDIDVTYLTATWMDDGTIIYLGGDQGLSRVSADGGPPESIKSRIVERPGIASVTGLPGSKGVLVTLCPGNCSIGSDLLVRDFEKDTTRLLLPGVVGAWYASTGHLLYTSRSGGLYAVGFDVKRLRVTSGAIPIIEDVAPFNFSLAADGSALYSLEAGGSVRSELVWVTRDGNATPVAPGWEGSFDYPSLSPDGKAIAVSINDGSTHLWIWRSDGTRQRLTREGTTNWRPAWTADARSVVFVSNSDAVDNIDASTVFTAAVDGSSRAVRLLKHTFGIWEAELSSDSQWLVFRSDEKNGDGNIYARRMNGDTTLLPLLVGPEVTNQFALSPDGRWLGYTSMISGRREVYVTSFPDGKSNRIISTNGGGEPRWSRSGRELFYKGDGRLMAVDVRADNAFLPGLPHPLFSTGDYRSARNRQQYDVSADGQRFVMIRAIGGRPAPDVVYVENWFEELKAKIRAHEKR